MNAKPEADKTHGTQAQPHWRFDSQALFGSVTLVKRDIARPCMQVLIDYIKYRKTIAKYPLLFTGFKIPCYINGTEGLNLNLFQQEHEENCQYGVVRCPACGETVERRHLERHKENDCVNRAVACTYCGGEVHQSNMKV